MTKKIKNSFLKMQGILRKGTVETLCALLLILFVVASCKEPEPIDKPESNGIKGTETTLQGTKWKLVGIVDIETQNVKILEPKHCEECYRLEFETDYDFTAFSINMEVKQNLLNSDQSLLNSMLWCEKYYEDGEDYCDSDDFRRGIILLSNYEVENRELKLFICNQNSYLLFKPLIIQEK